MVSRTTLVVLGSLGAMSLVTASGLADAGASASRAAARPVPRTVVVSVGNDGRPGAFGSVALGVSGNGRRVLFATPNALVPGDQNGTTSDVYLRDLATATTTLVSEGPVAGHSSDAGEVVSSGALSADGRYALFSSTATDLVPGDTNGLADAFVRDLAAGTTVRVSLQDDESQATAECPGVDISADGRFVSLQCEGRIGGGPGDGLVYVRDRSLGTTRLATVAATGGLPDGYLRGGSLSDDGSRVVFYGTASNLVPGDPPDTFDAFVRDLAAGTTTKVSVDSSGRPGDNAAGFEPAISGNGRYVSFTSSATDLVPGDTNGYDDIFSHDLLTGETVRVSVVGPVEADRDSAHPEISRSGRYVTFASNARNLVPDDRRKFTDIFVWDRTTATIARVSVRTDGRQAEGNSGISLISANGRHVLFVSQATNLSPVGTGPGNLYLRVGWNAGS